MSKLAGLRHDPRIGGERPGDIGIDLAGVGSQRPAIATAVVSLPPVDDVISFSMLITRKRRPRTLPQPIRHAVLALTSRILALHCCASSR